MIGQPDHNWLIIPNVNKALLSCHLNALILDFISLVATNCNRFRSGTK